MHGIRIAYLSNFSPRKLGTGENRIVGFAREARARGHRFTLYGREPVHPAVSQALEEAGATWRPLREVQKHPLRASRQMAAEFDVIQLNMVPPRSRTALAAYLAWPAKVLFLDRVSRPPKGHALRRSLPSSLLDRITMVRVHQVAGITEYVRDRARRRFGLPAARTCTIYNGVDTVRFAPREGGKRSPGPLRILGVANLIPEKGMDLLLRAVAELEPGSFSLRVAGDGPQAEPLKNLASQLGVENNVRFLGLRDDVPELLRWADIMVHPAVWQEALGNTILEGMASGCCVVASRVGGIPELAEDGVEAFFVEPGNPKALAKTLSALAEDPETRLRVGAAARKRAVEQFSLEASLARLIGWCEMAAEGKLLPTPHPLEESGSRRGEDHLP